MATTSFASLKKSAFMQLMMVCWCGVVGDEQCWVVLWSPPMKTLAALHHMHRAQLPDNSQVRWHLTMFILSWCAGRSFCSLSERKGWFTLGGQQKYFCSGLRRGQSHINSFMCIPSRNKTWIAATSFASQKYSALMQLVMVRWCGVLGNEQCWVVLWTPQ